MNHLPNTFSNTTVSTVRPSDLTVLRMSRLLLRHKYNLSASPVDISQLAQDRPKQCLGLTGSSILCVVLSMHDGAGPFCQTLASTSTILWLTARHSETWVEATLTTGNCKFSHLLGSSCSNTYHLLGVQTMQWASCVWMLTSWHWLDW